MDDRDDSPHLDKVDARAGSRTKVNRNILVVSLILVLAVMFAVVGFGFFDTERTGADQVNSDNSSVEAGAPSSN